MNEVVATFLHSGGLACWHPPVGFTLVQRLLYCLIDFSVGRAILGISAVPRSLVARNAPNRWHNAGKHSWDAQPQRLSGLRVSFLDAEE